MKKSSPINIIWFLMIVISIVVAAYNGKISTLTVALSDSAKGAAEFALKMIGVMALWLGIMKVVERGGLMLIVAKALKPITSRLFPDVPTNHPAMSAIIMNMAANMLGLGNAATPMGVKAMQELEKISPEKGTATDSMALFLAINTSSIALLPLGVINIRATFGSTDPASIFIPSLLATTCSTIVAISMAKLLARRNPLTISAKTNSEELSLESIIEKPPELTPPLTYQIILGVIITGLFLGPIFYGIFGFIADIFNPEITVTFKDAVAGMNPWLIPMIVVLFLSFGFFKGVPLYETVCEGAKEGFNTAVRIIPFMVAIFVAIGLVRASGTLDLLEFLLKDILAFVKMPVEALSMALIRPLSGSGAYGIMSEIVQNNPNSYVADLVSVMQGSTETTFYVLAVYFGAAGVVRTRHALPAALSADVAGIAAAVFFTHLFLG